MTDYLQRALEYLDAVGVKVLVGRLDEANREYVVVLNKGIQGCPKYRIPLAALKDAPKPKPEPIPEPEPAIEPEPVLVAPAWKYDDDLSYRDLQALAKELDIPANQSRAELIEALEEAG
jgi:hypothetical protein